MKTSINPLPQINERPWDDTPLIENAEIIAVGTELLMGQTLNSNASYLGRQLRDIGIPSHYQTVVGDNPDRLTAQINRSLERSDLVILTGGLGPTEDDITMAAAAGAAGRELIFDTRTWERIEGYFSSQERSIPPSNRKQACLPEFSYVLPNDNGTAPGALIPVELSNRSHEGQTRWLLLLPGPPNENQLMFETYARPWLTRLSPVRLESVYVRLSGIGESEATERLADLISKQRNPTIASYASSGEVMFRITAAVERNGGQEKAEASGLIEPVLEQIKTELGPWIYEIGERSLPQVVLDLLVKSGRTVGFAESCSAGLLASALGDIPGASAAFKGSVVAYSNDIKQELLGVSKDTLDTHGAVSEETALQMADGSRIILDTDYAVSVTGIAGPDGGTAKKPVGTVWIAVSSDSGSQAELLRLRGSRNKIRAISVIRALNLLRKALLDD